MVNRVILIGNLGRDPEVRRLENGAVVAKFSVATNENYRDKAGEWQTQTEWHDVVVWRNLADRADKQLQKGSQVYLEGKLTHRTWQDQDGNNRKTTEVVASYFRALTRRDEVDGGHTDSYPMATDDMPHSMTKVSTATTGNSGNDPGPQAPVQEADDDLPF
ncbi:MAG: single-stranded DNA-binding protein [Bacteroidetes bacterium]|nr:MAG: single-stranded DNA-binding protein [Bacteroidota bacterium]PTM12800.1 MAG: single-stranded DNA-binding protein [Bacteroidota bacterium]